MGLWAGPVSQPANEPPPVHPKLDLGSPESGS